MKFTTKFDFNLIYNDKLRYSKSKHVKNYEPKLKHYKLVWKWFLTKCLEIWAYWYSDLFHAVTFTKCCWSRWLIQGVEVDSNSVWNSNLICTSISSSNGPATFIDSMWNSIFSQFWGYNETKNKLKHETENWMKCFIQVYKVFTKQ